MTRCITLQFCSFDSLIARIIDWGTQGPGHVDIVLPPEHPQAGDLLGAQHEEGLGGMPAGVQIRPADYGKTSGMLNPVRVSLPTTAKCAAAAYDWALSMVGTPYDLDAIKGIALGEDWARPGHMICSGLGAGMLTQPPPSFIGHTLVRPWRIVTPAQLLLICNAFAPVIPVPNG